MEMKEKQLNQKCAFKLLTGSVYTYFETISGVCDSSCANLKLGQWVVSLQGLRRHTNRRFAEAVCGTHNVCSPWPNGAEATPSKQVCFYSHKLGRSPKLSRPVGVSWSSCLASSVFSLTSSDSSPQVCNYNNNNSASLCVTSNRQCRSKLVP